MNEIFTFAKQNPWTTGVIAYLCLNFILKCVDCLTKRLTIIVRGYPPAHCDIDGDEVEADENPENDEDEEQDERETRPNWMFVLGLNPGFTREQMLAQYRLLSKKHHPDAGGSASAFRVVQDAYKKAQQSFANR